MSMQGGTRLRPAGGVFLVLFPLLSVWTVPSAQGYGLRFGALPERGAAGAPQKAATIYLAEKEERDDSVVYRTDGKDREVLQRQREEREKEKKSWNMLNNVIIDDRQPRRRFSDPRGGDSPP